MVGKIVLVDVSVPIIAAAVEWVAEHHLVTGEIKDTVLEPVKPLDCVYLAVEVAVEAPAVPDSLAIGAGRRSRARGRSRVPGKEAGAPSSEGAPAIPKFRKEHT